MHKLMDYICDELEELERKADKDGKLSMSEIEYIDKLAHIKKDLLTSEAMWESSDYSEAGGESYPYTRNGERTNAANGAYARGRGRSARRDSMGRYTSRRSYDDDMMSELYELMEKAPDGKKRQKFQEFIAEMEDM